MVVYACTELYRELELNAFIPMSFHSHQHVPGCYGEYYIPGVPLRGLHNQA